MCPVYTLWCYCKLLKKLKRGKPNANGCLFVSNNLQTDSEGKIHRRITSADTIAKDTLMVMADAGIDTDTFHAHSLRGSTATKHLDDGAEERDVMAKGGWVSNSVFRTFYLRTRQQQITLDRLRQAKRGSELLKHSDHSADKAATVLDHDSRAEPTSVPGHDPQTREYKGRLRALGAQSGLRALGAQSKKDQSS